MKSIKQKIEAFARNVFGLLVKILIYLIPILFVWLVCHLVFSFPITFVYLKVIDPRSDTTGVTNFAFAIFAGIAAICFSWGRSVNQENKDKVKLIVKGGEDFFKCAILFLVASGIKYYYLYSKGFSFLQAGVLVFDIFYLIVYMIVFGLSTVFLAFGLYRIQKVFLFHPEK